MKSQKKMFKEIILASKSLVRKKILEENGIKCIVEPSNIDEDLVKESLLKENVTPKLLNSIGFLPEQSARAKIYKGKGCDQCSNTG